MNIAVVGAGIIGTATSLAIKEAFPKSRVTIFSDKFSPYTTGDGSAGFWSPYILSDTPADDVLRWSSETHRWLLNIWKSEFAAEAGVVLIPAMRLTSAPKGYPEVNWSSTVYGARKLLANDLERLNAEQSAKYTGGWQFVTFTSEPTRLIPWIVKKFQLLGGTIEQRKIEDLEELASAGFDLIINCSGLGARELVKDSMVKPVRGQVSRVDASWMFHIYLNDDDDGNYVIPNTETVVLGGTHQENDYNCEISEKDSKFIHEGCGRMIPALRGSKILGQWVGLRPARIRVRLEKESLRSKNGDEIMVIHNYGHGGSGVTLSWGCAVDVVKIMRDLNDAKITTSKL